MEAFGCRKEKVLPRIEDRAKLWQQQPSRRWLVFALVGALVALSSVLFLSVEEAQAKAEGSLIQKPVEKATGGFDKPAQKANGETAGLAASKDPQVKEVAKDVAATGLTPRVDKSLPDKPLPADAGPNPPPVAELVDRASTEVSRPVLEEAAKPADRSVLDKPTLVVSSAIKEVTSEAEPILREADDPALLREAALAVEPIPGKTLSATKPVLKEATPAIEPVLERAASEIEPVLDRAAPPVEPILKGIPSVVEPVLGSAGRTVDLVGEAAEPLTSPLLEATSLSEPVKPLSEKVVPPATAPVLGETLPPAEPGLTEAAPLADPSSETAPLAVRPFSGAATPDSEPILETTAASSREVVAPGNVELPALAKHAHYTPAVSPAISSHAPLVVVEAWGALPNSHLAPAALKSSFPGSTSEIRPSAVRLSDSYFEPFGRSSLIDGHRAILSDAAMMQGSQDPKQRPLPFRFPSDTPPPAASLLGSSGSGVALDLLGVLTMFLIISRTGKSLWSYLGAFRPDSPLQLAVERPD